jgi:ATP-dependent Clp protease ATP-binding subunit ClpX
MKLSLQDQKPLPLNKMMKKENKYLNCSFCGKKQNEVKKLIAGSNVFICNECVDLCHDIIQDDAIEDSGTNNINLLKPKEIFDFLNSYIIGQNEAKKVISVAVYNHYKRITQDPKIEDPKNSVEIQKSNILLVGPTGSGKTLFAKTLAKLLNVPFALVDATTLTEAGYVGEDAESILVRLLQDAGNNVEKAQKGIIYIDEIDKISRKSDSPSITRDVSGEGVQQALLKLIEGTIASISPQGGRKHPHQEYININTTNILFICGGSFSGIEKIIEKRLNSSGIGFNVEIKKQDANDLNNLFSKIETNDFVKFGLIPEFLGRLPIVSSLQDLAQKELVEVMSKPKNALMKQYQKLFNIENIDLIITDSAMNEIAKIAIEQKIGARGLRSIMEKILVDTMFETPSIKNIDSILIDEDVAKGIKKPIINTSSLENKKNVNTLKAKSMKNKQKNTILKKVS